MSKVYLVATPADDSQAHDIRHALTEHGYIVEPQQSYDTQLNRRTQQRGCVALIVVWNEHAAADEWVTWHGHMAQRLQQAIIVLVQDSTPLASVFQTAQIIDVQHHTTPIIDALTAILPPSDDLLASLLAQAGSFTPKERKSAIDHIATNLDSDERERWLAILEELARYDTMSGVQEKAKALLAAQQPTQQPVPPERSRFMVKVACANGHFNYFDKRTICPNKQLVRGVRTLDVTSSDLATFVLPCQTTGCGVLIEFEADCEGFRE